MNGGFSSPHTEAQAPTKENSTQNLRRSCEACRASKSRCCPSKDDMRRCQRCCRDGKQCVFLETKPRPKRAKTSRTRVAEMEKKLDNIFAMLSANNATPVKDVDFSEDLYPTPSTMSDTGDSMMIPCTRNAGMDILRPFEVNRSSSSWLKFDESQDVIGKSIVNYERAEALLRSYGTHAPNFPFIVFPSNVSVEFLRHEKPFLLLCILTVASSLDMQLQDRLETELRDTLGRKVIFNGEKSLDLLQGLLIYLAWYHQFFRPERQQIYQLSQMIIAMAVDLEISRPSVDLPSGFGAINHGIGRLGNPRAQRFPSELEAMRTFLGCYYLSSCLAVAFRKPNNLKYTDYIESCYQALSDANEVPSDCLLPCFIRLQRLAEEVNTTFDYGGQQQLPALEAVRIEMLVKTFRKQLKQLEDSFPSEVWHNVALRMASLHINIYINEIALHATRTDPLETGGARSSRGDWYSAVARTDSLVACIESAKKYLDAYLRLPKSEIFQNTIMEEIKLVYTILIIGRYTSGVDSPYLDASYLRETARLGHYMSALIEHLSEIIVSNSNGEERIDYFWHFRRIFQHTNFWYEEQVRGGYFTTLDANGLPDCMDFSFMEIMEMEPDPQYASEPELPQAAPVAEDELWTVAMLEAWPTSTLDPRAISFNGGFQ